MAIKTLAESIVMALQKVDIAVITSDVNLTNS